MALTLRKVFSCFSYICCFLQIFFNIFDARPLVLGLRFQDLILILEVDSQLCPLFWAECFAKVVKNFELLTNFAERFVHDWQSSQSASTHYNLLVFYSYLLLLLLLYLYVVTISCLFELITITSVQRSTKLCTGVVVLTLRDYLISLPFAFFMSILFFKPFN